MSSPLLDVEEEEEEGQSNVTLLTSSGSLDSVYPNISELKERNYMGISDCLSEETSALSPVPDESKSSLNLRATELRLGLPGSRSPERDSKPCLLSLNQLDKTFFPLHPSNDSQYCSSQKTVGSGSKRGFSDAMDGFFEAKYVANSEVTAMLSPRPSSNLGLKTGSLLQNPATQPVNAKETVQEKPHTANEPRGNHNDSANDTSSAPATKTQVVGWPPIRAFRKNSLASTSKNTAEVDVEAGSAPLFVKVRMDGAPYLRKVDLRNYSAYQELSSALEGMFSCFTIGQYGSHGALGREMLSENKLKDLLHGSEYVLTYEDKEGDLMLLGDVPWEMFIGTCKRLRLMKVSDAIGLAPRVMEKSSNQN